MKPMRMRVEVLVGGWRAEGSRRVCTSLGWREGMVGSNVAFKDSAPPSDEAGMRVIISGRGSLLGSGVVSVRRQMVWLIHARGRSSSGICDRAGRVW